MSYISGRKLVDDLPRQRSMLLGIAVLSGAIFFLLYNLSFYELSTSTISLIRTIFVLIGPMLSFIVFVLLGYTLLNIQLDTDQKKETFLFILSIAIMGIFFAISLNTRSLLVIFSLSGFGISDVNLILIAVGLIAPIIEEFVKVFPAIVIARHIKFDKSKKFNYFLPLPYLVFFGLVGGAVFNLLETYYYTWVIGSDSTSIISDKNWVEVSSQIFIRSTNPLHLVTAIIGGIGLLTAIYNSTEVELNHKNLRFFLPYFIISVLLHGAWNGSAVMGLNVTSFFDLPMFNLILYTLMLPLFFVLLLYARSIQFTVCDECGYPHAIGVNHNQDYLLTYTFGELSHNASHYTCENCKMEIIGKECQNCAAVEVYSCKNCYYPLPIYASRCWKCDMPVKLIYDDLSLIQRNGVTLLSKYFYYLLASLYIGQLFGTLYFVVESDAVSFLPNQIILNIIISLALIAGIYFNAIPKYQEWGLIISRYMTALVIMLLGELLLLVGIFYLIVTFYLAAIIQIFIFLLFTYVSFRLAIVDSIFVRDDHV